MDVSTKGELRSLIEKLVHSGTPSLDEGLVKKIKAICKRSDANIRGAYTFLMASIAEEHSEIRLSAFQLVNELFERSHFFRQLLTVDFQRLVTLVCGVDPHKPLPPPRPAADKLKETSLLAIRHWVEKFGDGYPKLKIGFNYLKHNKKVDFEGLVAAGEGERRRREQREARHRALIQQRLEEVQQEMKEQVPEIQACLTEIESCFQLLLPRFDIPADIGPPSATFSCKQPSPLCTGSRFQFCTSQSDSHHPTSSQSHASCQGNEKYKARTCSTGSESFHSIGGSEEDQEEEDVEEVVPAHTAPKQNQQQHEINPSKMGREMDSDVQDQELDPSRNDQEMDYSGSEDSDSDVEWEELVEADSASKGMNGLAAHGIVGQNYTLTFNLPDRVEVQEGEDNESIIATLRERQSTLNNKLFPMLNKWIEWFTRAGKEQSLKEAIDLKWRLSAAKQKYLDLHIISQEEDQSKHGSTDAVKKDVLSQKQHERLPVALSSVSSSTMASSDLSLDPTTRQAQLFAISKRMKIAESSKHGPATQPQSSSQPVNKGHGKSNDLRSVAPVLPYDVDLYSWESGAVPEPLAINLSSLHRFLGGEEREIIVSSEHKARMQCRVKTFTGEFEPVKWACRAPLPNGKLCPRKDRVKCPFHGRIIARDEQGQPTGKSEPASGPSTSEAASGSGGVASPALTWEDLSDDVLQMIGNDHLKSNEKPVKKKGKRKRKAEQKNSMTSGLTDLSALCNTPRSRIEKKIFNKKSMKRVAVAMNKLATKRAADKFADSFNYALRS